MDNEAKLNLMKKRVIGSFKWQEDIIIPFSKEFGCTTEDLEDLFMDLLDMSSLEALHGTLEIANHKCLLERLDADLRLPWYVDVLELLSVEQGDELKNKVAELVHNKIIDGITDYHTDLKNGVKITITLKKDANAQVVLNKLFKNYNIVIGEVTGNFDNLISYLKRIIYLKVTNSHPLFICSCIKDAKENNAFDNIKFSYDGYNLLFAEKNYDRLQKVCEPGNF